MDLNELRAGARLSGWRLTKELGRGSFGVTWAAEDENGRLGAVKALRVAPGAELRALARIYHPAVVGVLGGGAHPVHHIVMEFVQGRPLTHFLRSGAAPRDVALGVVALLADALAAIHHAGVSHGDLKPDNVLVESIRGPRLKIVDFGLAGTQRGGTLAYAAPERLLGQPSSTESDCYSLGLILWELVHGSLPWPELDLSEALMERANRAPEARGQQGVIREVLEGLLQVEPANRLDAAHVADRLRRHGVRLPPVDPSLVRRRAKGVHVYGSLVRDAVRVWFEDGGRLALVGVSGSGRSHLLDHLAVELQARGRPVLRIGGSDRPWAAVEQALHSPALPGGPATLPHHPDAERRAALAARALIERCPGGFGLLVDDWEDNDSSVHNVVAGLASRSEIAIAVAGSHAPRWSTDQVLLEPLDIAELRKLVRGLFGTIHGGNRLGERLLALADGLPGPTVDFLVGAVRAGAVVWRAQRWHLVPDAMERLLDTGVPELVIEQELSVDARQVGGTLALLEVPVSLDYLGSLVDLPADRVRVAMNELGDAGLIRLESRLASCRGLASAHALARLVSKPAEAHARIVARMLDQHEPDLVRLGWHVVGAGDRRQAEARGAAIVEVAARRDGREAARLADELWALAPHTALVAPRLRALVSSGRAEEGRRWAEKLLHGRSLGSDDVPVLIELARVYVGFAGRDDLALACVDKAREALAGAPLPPELVHAEAQIHFRAGRHGQAIDAARALADRPPPVGEDELDRWLRLRVVWAQALQGQGEVEQGLALFDGLPEQLGRGRAARALLDGAHGRLLWHAGRFREAADAMERAADEDAGLGALDRARLLNNAAGARYMLGDRPGALSRWEQALILFERLDVPLEQVRVQTNLCLAYREAARWERAVEAGLWAVGRATDLGEDQYVAMAAGNLGDVFLAQGSWADAMRWYRRAEGVAREHELHGELVELARRRAELAILRRDPRATGLAEHAQREARGAGDKVEEARTTALLAFCHARHGRSSKLDTAMEEALEPLRAAGASGELADARLWVAEGLLLVGRTDQALEHATRALVFADEVGHKQLRRRADVLVERIRSIKGVSLRSDRLGRLMELAVAVAEERDLQDLFQAIARAAVDLLDGDRAFVITKEPEGEPMVAASALAPGIEAGQPSMSVVMRALEDGREVLAADLGERSELRNVTSIVDLDLRSAMCVPMTEADQRLGAIYVDSRAISRQELESAGRLLRSLAAFGAVAATNARHFQDAADRNERAAELAHDLRSPASAIHVVVSDMLAKKSQDDPERQPLMRVLEAAQRIRSMASGILEEARPDDRRPVELSALVERVVGLLRHVAAQRGVRLEVVLIPKLWVDGDPQELARLITNLVSNALKYAPKGTRVSVGLAQDGQGVVGLVRDRGPGIPEGAEKLIFDRGQQARGAATGHGLGLYICQRIVREHGGSIEVRNHPRGGAVFTFRLPRRVRAWDSLPAEEVLD